MTFLEFVAAWLGLTVVLFVGLCVLFRPARKPMKRRAF
jgi:hypothetical protein